MEFLRHPFYCILENKELRTKPPKFFFVQEAIILCPLGPDWSKTKRTFSPRT